MNRSVLLFLGIFISGASLNALQTTPQTADSTTSAGSTISKRQPVYKKEQIVVTGSRRETVVEQSPVKVDLINSQFFKTTGMNTLTSALQEAGGILVSQNVRQGVQIMGLNPDYTLILIDGQPLIGRVAGVLDLQRISVGNIQQIEIVKGPMSSLYGSEALAGVINIITKKPEDGFQLDVYSQFLTKGPDEFQGSISFKNETFSVSVFGNYKHSPRFEQQESKNITGSDSVFVVPYSAFKDITAQTTVTWKPHPALSVRSQSRYYQTSSEGAFTESFFGQISSNAGSVVQSDFSQTFTLDYLFPASKLNFQSYFSIYKEQYSFDVAQGTNGNDDYLQRSIVRNVLQYDWFWNSAHRMTTGAEWLIDQSSGTRYPDSPEYQTFVVFAQWEFIINEQFSSTTSARFDHTKSFGDSFNPKISLLFAPEAFISLRSSIGTGFKAPDFRQLFVTFSNRLPGANYDLIGASRLGVSLLPEKSLSLDASAALDGIKFFQMPGSMIDRLSFDVRLFWNYLNNMIEFYYVGQNDNRAIYSYRNLSSVITRGLEFSLQSSLIVNDWFQFTPQFTYQYLQTQDNDVIDAINTKKAGTIDPKTGSFNALTIEQYGGLWFRPRHSATAKLQWNILPLAMVVNLRAQMIGRQGDEGLDHNGTVIGNRNRRVPDNDSEYIPAYSILNVAVSKEFLLPFISPLPTILRCTLGMNNILNSINLLSLPNIIGRQLFCNIAITL